MMRVAISKFGYTVTLLALFVALTVSTHGCGSDGDEEGAVDIPASVPELLNYEIRQNDGTSLNLNQSGGNLSVTSTLLTGSFNRITNAFSLNVQPAAMTVSAGDFLDELDTALGNDVDFSNYSLHVISAADWVGDENPTAGSFEVFDNEFRKITISVTADVNDTGTPGVDITYWPDGEGFPETSMTGSFTWDELDALFDNQAAEPYERIASFAYSLLRFMYEQGELVILALEFIDDNDTLLEETGPIVENCDTYPADPLPAVPFPGTSTVSWSDTNSDQNLGPGDAFFLEFAQCWDDDETDTIDTLFNGQVFFSNYTEVTSAGMITRIGFESSTVPGIEFLLLQITETETTPVNVVLETSETITLSGGFSMVFTSP